jgi:phage terminase small subunit
MIKLSRAKLAEAVESMPLDSLLGRGASKELTYKQKKFAREVARGATKADAYRSAYDVKSKHSLVHHPYELARNPRIKAEIEALKLAEYAQSMQTPAQLRALVIQTLVQTLLDPDTKAAVRVQAVKVLGTVTEVAAFTERKEVRTIRSSEDARTKVMDEIRALMLGGDNAQDIDAISLLDELNAVDDVALMPVPGDRVAELPVNDGGVALMPVDNSDPAVDNYELKGGEGGTVGAGGKLADEVPSGYIILSHSNDPLYSFDK